MNLRSGLAFLAAFAFLFPSPSVAGMMKYVNEKGEVVFVDSIDKIPPEFRTKTEKAGTGGASVSVLPDPVIGRSSSGDSGSGDSEGGSFVRKQPKSYLRATLYTRPGCGWCTKERAWLEGQGISFVEKNIRKDEVARKQLLQLVGEEAVPVLEIEGEVIQGFNPAKIQKVIQRHSL